MNIPDDLKYTITHEWVRAEDAAATVGLTDFAQQELGDIVFVELPAAGAAVSVGKPLGSIESVKAVSDIYAPVSGSVEDANADLADHPELVNHEPYGKGWLVKIALSNPMEIESLMDAAAYSKYIAEKG